MSYAFRGRALPEHLYESLLAYIETGRPTGGFLEACINNNLSLACSRADDINLWLIPVVHGFLYNKAPRSCWGALDSSQYWIKRKHAEREKASV